MQNTQKRPGRARNVEDLIRLEEHYVTDEETVDH
jgi:hypothetical protein